MKKMKKNCLTKDRVVFARELFDRIAQGNNMLRQTITTHDALENFKNEISKWSNYNEELLKQSFDNPDNEYKQEYKNSYLPLKVTKSGETA